MTESRRAPETTYIWQADKPLHMPHWQEIQKGQSFTPSSRMVRAFGDLMLTEREAKAREAEAEAEAKAQEEKAEREAARAARIAEGAGRPDYRDLAPEVQAHREAEREGRTSGGRPSTSPEPPPAAAKRPTKE